MKEQVVDDHRFPLFIEKEDNRYCVKNGLFMLTHQEVQGIINGICNTYNSTEPDEITEYNESVISFIDERGGIISFSDGRKFVKRKERMSPGYVYFLKMGEFTKIGFTTRLTKRLKELVIMPIPIKLICTYESFYARRLERELHELFSNKQSNGEWFRLDEDEIDNIKSHNLPSGIQSLITNKRIQKRSGSQSVE